VLQQPTPIIVRVVEEPVKQTTLADVIFGSLGLVGILLISAALLGLALGAALIIWKRLRRHDGLDSDDEGANLRVTPTS